MFGRQNSEAINTLKWFAAISMMIDHIGILFFDNCQILRDIGRVAFPLFGYILVHNYMYFTSDRKKYIKRVFLLFVISQPVFQYAFGALTLNIIFLFFLTLLLLYVYSEYRKLLAPSILLYIVLASFADYGVHGGIMLLLLCYGFLTQNHIGRLIAILGLPVANYYSIEYIISTYLFIPIYYLAKFMKLPNISSRAFYFLYPVHLLILAVIRHF